MDLDLDLGLDLDVDLDLDLDPDLDLDLAINLSLDLSVWPQRFSKAVRGAALKPLRFQSGTRVLPRFISFILKYKVCRWGGVLISRMGN